MSNKIKPRIVDGEPMCTLKDCPEHNWNYEKQGLCICAGTMECVDGDSPCIPGLRQQRETLEAELEKEQKMRSNACVAVVIAKERIGQLEVKNETLESRLEAALAERDTRLCDANKALKRKIKDVEKWWNLYCNDESIQCFEGNQGAKDELESILR